MSPYPREHRVSAARITVHRRADRQPQVVIPTLRGSTTLGLCVLLYQRHQADRNGRCRHCLVPASHCQTRRNAMKVIVAAGYDPALFDDQR